MTDDTKQPPGERSDVQLAARVLPERAQSPADRQRRPVPALRRRTTGVAKRAHPAAAEIPVEVDAGEPGNTAAAIDVSAGHRAPVGVPILDGGEREPRLGAARGLEAVESFHHVPPVVHPARAGRGEDIDFLPEILADIADVEIPGPAIERKAPRVPQPVEPDLPSLTRVAGEWIVRGDRVGRTTVDVDPQDFGEQRVEILPVPGRIIRCATITQAG